MRCEFFFFKQKTAYEMSISDWSSDVCSSDLINGVGYRAQMQGKNLSLQLGYSHDISYPVPEGIKIALEGERGNVIAVSGSDKQRVGQVASEIRGYRRPEPYKGKGIKYQGETILRKEGKKK